MATNTHLVVALSFLSMLPFTPCAHATLTVDLRATSTTSGTVLDPKHVLFTGGVGDTVTMDVYMVITGMVDTDTDNDFLDYLHGSFLSSSGGLRGDLEARLVGFYSDFISSDGLMQDLDGDADLDIGSNDDSSIANFFRSYKWREAPRVSTAKIATLKWTNTSPELGAQASMNFRPRNVATGAQWAVDGNTFNPSFGLFRAGQPVSITHVPEPAACAMVSSFVALMKLRHERKNRRGS